MDRFFLLFLRANLRCVDLLNEKMRHRSRTIITFSVKGAKVKSVCCRVDSLENFRNEEACTTSFTLSFVAIIAATACRVANRSYRFTVCVA